MCSLIDATLNFERILPVYFYGNINTTNHYQYGQLHHVYYDLTDIDKEDKKLIELLKPFVEVSSLNISGLDKIVVNLRHYLARKGYVVNSYQIDKITKVKDLLSDFISLFKKNDNKKGKLENVNS